MKFIPLEKENELREVDVPPQLTILGNVERCGEESGGHLSPYFFAARAIR